jgi:hypothetical protein
MQAALLVVGGPKMLVDRDDVLVARAGPGEVLIAVRVATRSQTAGPSADHRAIVAPLAECIDFMR